MTNQHIPLLQSDQLLSLRTNTDTLAILLDILLVHLHSSHGKNSLLAITIAMAGLMVSNAAPYGRNELYPNIAKTSHASPQAVKFFHDYFTAKSTDNADALLEFFNPNQGEYYDATLGLAIAASRSELLTNLKAIAQGWAKTAPNDRSYPLRILGDTMGGALVYFVDTPGLFGAEIRSISSFDFLDGTVRRQLDNWDGRGNIVKSSLGGDAQYPYNLGLAGVKEKAAVEMKRAAYRLNNALSAGNATAAAVLFSYDAVFEDLTLRARVEGQIAISSYLQRSLHGLPYGPGTEVSHVLGSARGGGYEWRPSGNNVRYGITGLELDCSGNITRFTAVWDGSRLNQTAIQGLAELSPAT